MSGTDGEIEAGIEEIDGEGIVVVTDDAGNTVRLAILLIVEIEGQDYAALTPEDQLDADEDEEQEIYLFMYDEQPGDEEGEMILGFSPIADEDEYRRVEAFCADQLSLLSGG